MNNTLRFKTLCLLTILAFSSNNLYSTENDNNDKNTEIINGPSIRPRTPTDLSGYYSAGILYLHFAEEYASIEIEVTNLTSGDYWQEEVINPASTETIQIGEIPGDYQIVVTTSSGSSLYGYFTL